MCVCDIFFSLKEKQRPVQRPVHVYEIYVSIRDKDKMMYFRVSALSLFTLTVGVVSFCLVSLIFLFQGKQEDCPLKVSGCLLQFSVILNLGVFWGQRGSHFIAGA